MHAWAAPRCFTGLLLSTFSFLGLAGCDSGHSSSAPGATPAISSLHPEVEVLVVNGAKFREALDRHRGKVVLVDFWATWCGPCKKLFPHQFSGEPDGLQLGEPIERMDALVKAVLAEK